MTHFDFTTDTFNFAADAPLSEQIWVLEDAYADALADGCDRDTLNNLFDRIKHLREQLAQQHRFKVA